MIASLSGTVLALNQQQVVIDVSGVGYQLFITPETSSGLNKGQSAFLHTALIVREDAFTLFGFATLEELEMFDLLRSVTGVGPKSALGILASMSSEQIRAAVIAEDDGAFKRVSGIGPKTAKLITVTLAGKLAGISSQTLPAAQSAKSPVDLGNLIAALQGLGWNERQASDAVRSVAAELGPLAGADALLKAALAQLGSSKSVSGGA